MFLCFEYVEDEYRKEEEKGRREKMTERGSTKNNRREKLDEDVKSDADDVTTVAGFEAEDLSYLCFFE